MKYSPLQLTAMSLIYLYNCSDWSVDNLLQIALNDTKLLQPVCNDVKLRLDHLKIQIRGKCVQIYVHS